MDIAKINHEIELNNVTKKIINNPNNLNFKSLNNKLSEVIFEKDEFLLISNKGNDMEDKSDHVKSNPTGEGKELLNKDTLKEQKILLLCYDQKLWI